MSKINDLIEKYCKYGVEYKTIEELGDLYNGLTGKNKADFNNGKSKYISYMNVFSNIEVNLNDLENVCIKANEKQNTVEYGDVIFTASSETAEECGMSSVITNKVDENIYLNSFCFGLRLKNKELFLPGFLKYLFRDIRIRKEIVRATNGVTRHNISKARFKRIKIPLPPIQVQEEIVRILDKFTQLEAELEAELEARIAQNKYYKNKLLEMPNLLERERERERERTLKCREI